jgi:hypothetical protein
MKTPDRWLGTPRAVLIACAAALLAPVALAAESPPAPYWSVHLATHANKDQALAALKALGDEPAARAEKRKSGWLIRLGAWADKAQAEAALARLGKGAKDARVLQIENPVEWLLASGERVPPPGAAAATAAPAASVAAAAADAGAKPAAAPAVAAVAAIDDASLKAAAQKLDGEVRRLLERGAARADGYVYTMDLAPLLLYAAQRRDAALYAQVLDAAQPLVVGADDAATAGLVLWRHKAGEAPEVSGATEALWLARALWAGDRLLKRREDRALALRVLDGYARHAATANETWFVRKYYAFGTKSYASLSVLPNYHPDFLDEAEPQASAKVRGLARRSYTLLQRAVTPSKLLVPLVQPDINTVLPGVGVNLYAPNGVVVLEDSCGGAEGAQRGVPQLARNVLDFVARPERRDANGRLFAYYHRKDGRPVGETVLSSTGYACLTRMAAAAKDKKALAVLKPALLGDVQALADAPGESAAPLYAAGPLLLAADALNAL